MDESTWDWLKTEAHKRRCTIRQLLAEYQGMANMTPEQRAAYWGDRLSNATPSGWAKPLNLEPGTYKIGDDTFVVPPKDLTYEREE